VLSASVTPGSFDLYVAVNGERSEDVSRHIDGNLSTDQQSAAETNGTDDELSEETSVTSLNDSHG